MSSNIIKPGELRILEALKEESLSDKELKKKARLANPNVRIRYLRHLWKQGLITRDIDTRKYSILPSGSEVLRLVDRMKILLGKRDGVDIPRGKVNG